MVAGGVDGGLVREGGVAADAIGPLVMAQQALRPFSDTCLPAKFAYTPWPTRSDARARASATLNWKTWPLAVTLAVTMPVAASMAVMPQHGAAGCCAPAGANDIALTTATMVAHFMAFLPSAALPLWTP